MIPWRNVVRPHQDIREGRFDESVFAASLWDVVQGRGPLEYRDAATFFRKTYPTQGLVRLLSSIVSRLGGKGHGEGVIQIQTPFGGGKTHALVALYHLFRRVPSGAELVERVLSESGLKSIPPARTVTFDGTGQDALKGRTPWGELAAQLGRYELLAEHDQRRRSPGKELLHQLLADGPTLLLMDEIAEYAAKAIDFQEQVMAFFQELTETVKILPHCAMVATLPSSAPYGETAERVLNQLQRIFGRVEAIYTPVEGMEVYEVIRRRLFEDLGDPQDMRHVVEEYWQMYQRLGEDIPAEAREPGYRERMRRAYPFHPQLIDILYERWGTIPTFQRTRGVLRLLAQVVADLYNREHPAPLIQVAHLNLREPKIRHEFVKHIGNEYELVIAADIAGENAKAERLDREMGSEYARFGVAAGLATAIFFGSFSGGQKRGINVGGLRLALLREGMQPAVVGDALRRLEEELWYLHVESGLYQFRKQPNLNRIILEREESVDEESIAKEIRDWLKDLAGKDMKVLLFPVRPADIPDDRDLKLAVLESDHLWNSEATRQFVRELFEKSGDLGTAFRVYRNTLLVLVADYSDFVNLRQQVKRALALRAIQNDKNIQGMLSDENKKTVNNKLRDIEDALDFQLLVTYRRLAKAGPEDIQWFDLGIPTKGYKSTLSKRVRDYLKNQELLLERLAPRHILEKALGQDAKEKPLSEVYDAFLRYPHLPLLESEAVLRRAVAQGVQEGVFGVRTGEGLHFRESVVEEAIRPEAMLVHPDALQVKQAKEQLGQAPTEVSPAPAPSPRPPSPPVGITRYFLKALVPWEKMSDFLRGVLVPLHSDKAKLEVEITLRVEAPAGIKKATLDQKVNETLRQIGAKVLEERRE